MLGLLKKSINGNGSIGSPQVGSIHHKFTTEELAQVKMLDLRQIMKDKGVRLSWMNGQYEGACPFHDDLARSPKLMTRLDPKGVWRWQCGGGHHGGDTISFAMECHGTSFPRAVEYLKQLITPMPKLNGEGLSIGEILEPVTCSPVSQLTGFPVDSEVRQLAGFQLASLQENRQTGEQSLVERQEDTATFKYGELIYHAKDLKNATKNSLKIILKLTYQDSHFTDRTDLHSARVRRSFANQASERLNLQSAQVEEHLESLMETLEQQLASSPVGRLASEKPEMTEEDKSQALTLLKDPNLLDRMAQDLDKLGYVGEAINKKILYLVGTSRLLDKPISAIVRSGSGAGKSALIEKILNLFPPEDVLLFSRITPQSLFYMGQEALDRKILAIDEREGSQAADYSIRTLQSRGKLTLAASQKDPKSGEWKTLTREFAARTPYMESSTKEKLNEENLNRCFELYLDESSEQTKRILEAQRKAAAGIDQLSEEEKTKLMRLYQNAQKLLEPKEIKIPYELEVSLSQTWIRTRRDHERFLSLIKVIVLLHQKQRSSAGPLGKINQEVQRSFEGGNLKAEVQDIKIARVLLEPILGELTNDLAKPVAVFYELLKKKVHEEAGAISIEDFTFTRRQIREWLSLPDHIVKRSMKALEDLEYVEVKKSARGSRYQYNLSSQ